MRFALVNPPWTFDGSIYFGCREPHLPLEFRYAAALLEQAGHETVIIDGQLDGLTVEDVREAVIDAAPDFTVITTAPSYLFWRCPPPELRVPQQVIQSLFGAGGMIIAVGPHGSTTPPTTLRKLGADAVVVGECEEVLPAFATTPRHRWSEIPSICHAYNGSVRVQGSPYATNMQSLPALRWPDVVIRRHDHHHHRFDAEPSGAGAEMETSRGCPYQCSFCAKDNYRNRFRRRPLSTVLDELDGLVRQGVEYVYFVDEIFMPNRDLLQALAARQIKFGIQTRIDLWRPEMIDLLAAAGCVSIEAGIESISQSGREALDKHSRLSTEGLTDLLIYARRGIPFVQGNLIEAGIDDPGTVRRWRSNLLEHGVWANVPVPLFPYPGSPDYARLWGEPDDQAWERAHDHYLKVHPAFSDIQDERPVPLARLELTTLNGR